MNVVSELDVNSMNALCDWLADGTCVSDLELVTDHLWARTYRVNSLGKTRYLKVLPPNQAGAISAMPLLSKSFPDTIPQTLAIEETAGLVLLDQHGGTDLGRHPSARQKQQILSTYATIQGGAASNPELLTRIPRLSLTDLVPAFLQFLNSEQCSPVSSNSHDWCVATARDFFSENRCDYYAELFEARAELLTEFIGRGKVMPETINHCDLRSRNTAERKDGNLIIFDWDETVVAPAGLSLHNFFSGCSIPCEMLINPTSAMQTEYEKYRPLLSTYMRTLVSSDYCDPETLTLGLPGSICAGVIHYILSYSKFLPPDSAYQQDVADIIRKRLNDLLKLTDLPQLSMRETTLAFATTYQKLDRPDHACRTLAKYLEQFPTDSAATEQLAELLILPEHQEKAETIYPRLLEQHPDSGRLRRHYGFWNLQNLALDTAVTELTRAVQLGETDDETALALDQALEFQDAIHQAKKSGELPTIRVTADEQAEGKLNPIRRKLAVKLFKKYGTLVIENAFSVPLVEQMHAEYLERYQRYFVNEKHADALKVGSKRYMITVDVEGIFSSPQVYANPHIAPIIQDLLGNEMIMGGFNSVCSLPEAESMKIHKDHPALFPETSDPNNLPSFAVTAIVPLRGFNKKAGTTRVYKGSHQQPSHRAKRMEYQDPEAPTGSCLLMDYRLTHQGRANKSDQVRPILTMIYHRPWFRDIVNYEKQKPVQISNECFAKVPEEHKHLFAWSKEGR